MQANSFGTESFEPNLFDAGLRVIYGDGGEICIGNELQMDCFAIAGANLKLDRSISQTQSGLPRNLLTHVDHETTHVRLPRQNIATVGILA